MSKDAIPVHRGLSRVAIVDQLLETATDMVDVELLMMDRKYVWRLTDLLVKLELRAESEFRYEPLVTADLFLTIAKDYVGLDPSD